VRHERAKTLGSDTAERVLVAGIYLADRENNIVPISSELGQSKHWIVDQQWIALGRGAIPDGLAPVTVSTVETPTPKFVLLNQLLGKLDLDRYSFVLVCDDDIGLPPGFVDRYMELVVAHEFALAQPARSHCSDIGHVFVEALDGLTARWTRFVEIGPVFSMRHDAARLLLPFDETSPMGWGYDFIWPVIIEKAGLRMVSWTRCQSTIISGSMGRPMTMTAPGRRWPSFSRLGRICPDTKPSQSSSPIAR